MARNSGGGFGTWFYGFLVGGVIGVGCCAAAALYITKAPIPFVNKVNQASEKINPIAGGTIPDPNKPLSASGGAPVNAPKSRVVTVEPPTSEQAAEETKLQIEQGSRFVVQAGAFSTQVDAEARRAELGFLGFEARVIPRTDGAKTLYRVRLGPYGTAQEANDVKSKLQANSITATVGREGRSSLRFFRISRSKLMLRRILLSACLLLPVVGYASAENPVAGQDYTVLKTPVQTQEPKKIEVLTFFAYTCPHCYTYEKDVPPWSEKLPDDVVFRQIPVAWTPKSFHFTKTYYALEAMHKLHPYHEMLFNAVIKERKEFPDLNSIADFFAQNGLNKEEFLKNANSFSTKVKNDRAFKTWQAYEIDGTPANAVNGKYITAPHMVGTREGAIQVMNYLIEKERAAKK